MWQDPYAQALKDMDFSALRQQNPDVLGWILIPGTRVSYPVVQGTDNSYYLDHTWRGGKNSVGAIFMDYRNSGDLSDFNTIIYGHRMNNRSMFGTLSQYKSRSYWQAHPYVYLTDDSGTHRYEIFAAGEVSVDSDVYRLGLRSSSGRQSFLDSCLSLSALNTGVTPHVYDKVLTLSTCTGNGHATRWVVPGRLPRPGPRTPAGGDRSAAGTAPGACAAAPRRAPSPRTPPSRARRSRSRRSRNRPPPRTSAPRSAQKRNPETNRPAKQNLAGRKILLYNSQKSAIIIKVL